MENLLGTWELVETQGLKEFLLAIGMPEEVSVLLAETLLYTVEYGQKGDNYTFLLKTVSPPNSADRSGEFKLGEPLEAAGPFGTSSVTITTTVEGDTIVENFRQEDSDKTWRQVKEINGNVMVATSTYEDRTLVQKFKKIN